MPMRSIKMRISNKNMQKLVFFSEKTVFLSSRCEKSSKFSVKNASLERAEEGLSSHAFISIFIFLTKIDFFGGGVALRHSGFIVFWQHLSIKL